MKLDQKLSLLKDLKDLSDHAIRSLLVGSYSDYQKDLTLIERGSQILLKDYSDSINVKVKTG